MNKRQGIVLIITTVVLVGMSICPPFEIPALGQHCYNFVWAEQVKLVELDFPLLLTQWAGILIVGGILFFVLRD